MAGTDGRRPHWGRLRSSSGDSCRATTAGLSHGGLHRACAGRNWGPTHPPCAPAPLTFKGGGHRAALGPGGQAADSQVTLCAAPVVQHAGVHCGAWGRGPESAQAVTWAATSAGLAQGLCFDRVTQSGPETDKSTMSITLKGGRSRDTSLKCPLVRGHHGQWGGAQVCGKSRMGSTGGGGGQVVEDGSGKDPGRTQGCVGAGQDTGYSALDMTLLGRGLIQAMRSNWWHHQHCCFNLRPLGQGGAGSLG